MEMGAGAQVTQPTPCPNCWHHQQTADRRWVELQNLRARLLAFEGMVSEYLWLVSETAANELDQEEWQVQLEQAKERALELLGTRLASDSPLSASAFGRELGQRV